METHNSGLDKVSAYLTLKKKEINRQYDPKIVDRIIENLKKGCCFGFSLCYATMTLQGRLSWWRAMLVQAYYWNGSVQDLSKHVLLPGSLEKKPIALDAIFEKLIHYAVFHQASKVRLPFLNRSDLGGKSYYKSIPLGS